MTDNPIWDPHTVIDFADIAPNYKPGRIHVAGGVWVNGSPVRMSTKGPRLIYKRSEPTLVRLDLMPDEINFGAAPKPHVAFDPMDPTSCLSPRWRPVVREIEVDGLDMTGLRPYEHLRAAGRRPRKVTVTFMEVF